MLSTLTVRRLVLGGSIAAFGAFIPDTAAAQTDTGMARTTTTTDMDDDDDSSKLGLLGLLGLAGLLGMRKHEPTVVHRDAAMRDTETRR